MKIKRVISFILVISILITITGCKKSELEPKEISSEQTINQPNEQPTKVTSESDLNENEQKVEEDNQELKVIPISHNMKATKSPIILGTEGFPLVKDKIAAGIYVDEQDLKGVHIAVESLGEDITLVSDVSPVIGNTISELGANIVIAGTIDNNQMIRNLINEGKLDVSEVEGKWESYVIEIVDHPLNGIDKALVIAGSDKRGTIYGIYRISEAIGVSPWVWWADSVPFQQEQLILSMKDNRFVQGEPSVMYRGIFLNDENPSLYNWVNKTYGGFNSEFYGEVFELILRLKGNYLWPAMWGKAFNEDDPKSPKLADDYGIVMGTSHHEPMMRAQKEWSVHGPEYGDEWNYYTNAEGLYRFWEDRIIQNAPYEKLITIGMRGDGDMPMIAGGSVEQHIDLLTQIVTDQREIIEKHINEDVTKVPQVWTLYKEVEDYYKAGMKVPEDVILMLAEDNFGNVRTLPTDKDRDRAGGFGMYYHFDFVGAPRSYKWINTVPLTKIWEQMTMAYDYGVNKIWIVNVGDLKPMELPIDYFLDLAYDYETWSKVNQVEQFTYDWSVQQFGEIYAYDIVQILDGYTKMNGRRKPEIITPDTYSVTNYNEAQRILAEFEAYVARAEEIYEVIPDEKKDAYYQLVLYPTKASMLVLRMNVYAGLNKLYAKQGRVIANEYTDIVDKHVYMDMTETRNYHKNIAGGKWDGMMSQAHMGQTSWEAPEKNVAPKTKKVKAKSGSEMIIGVPNTEEAYRSGEVYLADFTDINRETVSIDIANGGDKKFDYSITPSHDFIIVSEQSGTVELQNTFTVTVDFNKLADDVTQANGTVSVKGAGSEVILKVNARRIDVSNLPKMTFVETHGYLSIEAEHYSKNVEMDGGKWTVIDEYGRTLSSVKVLPNRLSSRTPKVDAPYLEYSIYTQQPGTYEITTYAAPTNNLSADTGMKYAISMDDNEPQIVDSFPNTWYVGDRGHQWGKGVMDNVHINKTTHKVSEPGLHTIRIYMVDAGFTLQKLVIDTNGSVLSSYLGPEETYYVK
ncbi:glycosyl hydrolase 115 family protein [Mobilitalea sibirica]|uniref:Glycosyl hydrolase 115 family protein n=1 Tax=Mobilitalea sibirica TaxID=1462919 RepID=A0A8J7H5Y2_9FIRM|nr:glycosyl hydrolase 115 family protein [Mobilitalea sibirica]MBH1941969.1 glycosyl hydrolase 115 family protein [Mobilitalea sibirica]